MSNFLDKVKIKTGVGRTNKFDLSCTHVTTQDMFVMRPVYARELMPGQSINVSMESFTRLAPLDKPFFGGLRMVNRAFFVPFRTIFRGFNQFITDTEYVDENGDHVNITTVPYFDTRLLVGAIMVNFPELYIDTSDSAHCDFVFEQGSVRKAVNWTKRGAHFMTILHSLGYNISGTIDLRVNVDTNMKVSALPLMAFAKVICDWYTDPQYSSRRNNIEGMLHKYSKGGPVDVRDLIDLISWSMYSLYDRDYFTSAFDNPLVPNDGTSTSVEMPDIDNNVININTVGGTGVNSKSKVGDNHILYDPSNGNSPNVSGKAFLGSYNSSEGSNNYAYRGFVASLNQYMLDSLKALTDYIRRYQLVGNRTLDRYLALFGIQLPDAKLERSTYIGKSVVNIDIADVMSTAQTDLANVGDYAAKGIGHNPNQSFSFKTDEFGIFTIFSTIIPRISYTQGMLRRNLHIDRFDFFSPDFDALGTQAIARGELYNDMVSLAELSSVEEWDSNGIFGYTPRFSEYAVANDILSGDFRFGSKNVDLDAWHMFRLFHPVTADEWSAMQHHDENFNIASDQQYNRIFNFQEGETLHANHFYCVHNFRITSRMPKKPLFEQYDFDEGRAMITNLGGTNLN